MAYLLTTNGEQIEVEPANGEYFSLIELQKAVGGYVEHLRLPSGEHLWLNENGKSQQLPRNERATLLGRSAGIFPTDFVVGNVLVCEDKYVQKDED